MVFINAPMAADNKNPTLPAGTYVLKGDGEGSTILGDGYSAVVHHYETHNYEEAWLKVEYDNKNQAKYDLTVKADDGKVYHTIYQGNPTVENQAITWVSEDRFINGGTVRASYLTNVSDYYGCNMNVTISENGDKYPNNYITLVGNIDMTEQGRIKDGTWTIVPTPKEGEDIPVNSLLAGRTINFGLGTFVVDSNLRYYKSAKNIEVGLFRSGTARVTSTADTYTLNYEFITKDGVNISGTWTGPMEVQNHPYAASTLLESDYEVDMSKCTGTIMSAINLVEVAEMNEKFAYTGNRIQMVLKPKTTFRPGVYKLKADDSCAGSFEVGKWNLQLGSGEGSVFAQYENDGSQKILKAAEIHDGQVEIIDNGNGIWTFKYDLLDGQAEPKRITGTYTGPVTYW